MQRKGHAPGSITLNQKETDHDIYYKRRSEIQDSGQTS